MFDAAGAEEAFGAAFATPARAALTRPSAPTSGVLYKDLGKLWAQTRRDIAHLDIDADEVEGAIQASIAGLWSS